jgi:hypothetical protein
MGPAQKKSSPVIPILIVVVLIAVGVGAFFLLSGGDDEAGSDPAATVEAYFNAGQDRDCEAAGELLSNAAFESFGGREAALQACQAALEEEGGLFSAEGAELVSTDVGSEDDSSATVTAEIRSPEGETTSQTFDLVKEDGEWKIGTLGGSGSTPPPSGDDGGGSPPPDGSTDTSLPTDDGSGSGSDDGSGGSGDTGSGSGVVPPDALSDADPEDIPVAEACAGGDMAACDTLWGQTPTGSNIEAFAESCGGLDPGGAHERTCEEDFG